MCILYKQQMQQHSDNTSSRSYRNAARDFDKNCSNPPPIEKSQVAVTPANNTVSEPVTAQAEDSQLTKQPSVAVNPLDSNSSVANSEPVEVQTEASVIVETVESKQVEQKSSAETTVEPARIKVTAPGAVRAESDSLLMPSLLLLVVLLLAAMLLLRLRANKKAAVEIAPIIPATNEASSTEAAVSKSTPAKTEPAASGSTTPPEKAVIAEQVVIAMPQTEVASSDDVNVKVELTQRLFKNEHDFKEPEVRMFDPDAPLPGQKPQQPKDVIKPTINVEADLEINLEPQQTTTTELHNEAEQLPKMDDEIAQALVALNDELAAEQHSGSEHDEIDDISGASEADLARSKANPFANLSLDPTWDPNSKQKPTIVPKKTVPKSAKLIAAQKRAKQLKIDD